MYNTSASQFAGGGFMPSQENAENRAAGSAQKKSFDPKESTLRSLTVKQVFEAAQNTQDDTLMLDGRQVTNITIVGKIVDVVEENIYTLYTIDDGTGKLLAKYWTPSDDDDFDKQRRAEWRTGVYVRVHGHLSSVGREKSMVAFNMRLITDFNEVTYHLLQCIFQHLHLTKGSGAGATAGGAAGGFPMKQEQPVAGGYTAPGGYAQAPAAVDYNPNTGMNPCQAEVMKIMQGPEGQGDHGISIQDVVARLGNRFNYGQVKDAIEFLSNEGHVYSTIDDQHYRTCT